MQKCFIQIHVGVASNMHLLNMVLLLLKMGKYLGFAPISTKNKTFIVILNVCHVFVFIVFSFIAIPHLGLSILLTVLTALELIIKTFFLLICLVITFTQKYTWKLFLKELKKDEEKREAILEKFLIVFLFHIVFIVVVGLELRAKLNSKEKDNTLGLISWSMFHFNQYLHFLKFALTNIVIKIIADKYNRLNILLEKTFEKKLSSKKLLNKYLSEIIITYKTHFNLVQHFNSIFGWPILIILGLTLFKMVSAMYYGMYINHHKSEYIATGILQIILYAVSLLVVFTSVR